MDTTSAPGRAWEVPSSCPPHVEALLRALIAELRAVLGDALAGVYLYGSLVAGDFDPEVSDVDLLAAVRSDVDDRQLGRLRAMHEAFARAHPEWEDRIDVSYLSTAALRTFPVRESPIVVISPGEPIHRTETSPGWLMNWHLVREGGVALLGPSPRALIAPTTREDFAAAVRTHLRELPRRVDGSRAPGFHAYAVLTACRGLHACAEGRQASKAQAADWAARRHPEWASVIRDALARRNRRRTARADVGESLPAAADFVRFAVQQVAAGRALQAP